jgi:hypothetical protein
MRFDCWQNVPLMVAAEGCCRGDVDADAAGTANAVMVRSRIPRSASSFAFMISKVTMLEVPGQEI